MEQISNWEMHKLVRKYHLNFYQVGDYIKDGAIVYIGTPSYWWQVYYLFKRSWFENAKMKATIILFLPVLVVVAIVHLAHIEIGKYITRR